MGARRRRGADRGFVLSDHCDWPSLLEAIDLTGADNVYVTPRLHRYIFETPAIPGPQCGLKLETEYEGELAEIEAKADTSED